MPPLLKDIRRLKNNFDSYSSIGLGPLVSLDLISSKLLALASVLHLLYLSDFLLSAEKHQSVFIKTLEKQYPGITKVNRDSRGEIIIDDAIDNGRWDTLIEEINRAVKGRQAILGSRA